MDKLLNAIIESCRHFTREGKVACYIPELSKAEPDDLSIF